MEKIYKGYKITVDWDSDRDYDYDPRREWDNLGTMVCFHKRYNLGDEHEYCAGDFSGWEHIEDVLMENHNTAVILPIYIYDHSGITINTTGFSCPWDSGQVGFIFISKEKVREEYKVKRISKKLLKQVEEILQNEVKIYDRYLRGDILYYEIEKDEEHQESCYGFYENEEVVLKEAMEIVDYLEKSEREQKTLDEQNYLESFESYRE